MRPLLIHVHFALSTKLPQVMIGVQIPQSHPRTLRHLAKMRMRYPREIPRLTREPLDETPQFPHVRVKLGRWSTTAMLIQLGHSFETCGPRHRQPQRHPSQQQTRIRNRNGLRRHLPQIQPKPVAQVADHLMRRHPAPPSRAARLNRLQPTEDFFSVFRVVESLHRSQNLRKTRQCRGSPLRPDRRHVGVFIRFVMSEKVSGQSAQTGRSVPRKLSSD